MVKVAKYKRNLFRRDNKFIIIVIIILFAVVLAITYFYALSVKSDERVGLQDRLASIERNIVSGGPPKDGIPPVDKPRYVSLREADSFLHDNDIVFGVNHNGFIAAYPQKILVWHEIVNDNFTGNNVSVTYCPLTGSVIGFKGKFNSQETTFGTSGKLVNSNLVMYDRISDSYWPQILGVAVKGPDKGKKLDEFPVVWTTWGKWNKAFPETKVLSKTTGFIRAYGNDPYGSYDSGETYYQQGDPFFPVMTKSNLFQPKEVFIGIEDGTNALAVRKDAIRVEKVINTLLGSKEIVVIYDKELDDALAFKNNGRKFRYQDSKVIDDSGSVWSIWGISDKSERLEFVNSFNVMWFAWYAFYTETEIYTGD